MRYTRLIAMALAFMTALTLMGGPALAESADAAGEAATVTGRVTAVSVTSITMDLGTLAESADASSGATEKPDESAAPDATAPDTATASDSGTTPDVTPAPDATVKPDESAAMDPTAPDTAAASDANVIPDAAAQRGPLARPFRQRAASASAFTASGESMTFSITDSTIFTLDRRKAAGSISDISVGAILTVTLSGDAATAVTILRDTLAGGFRGNGGWDNKPGANNFRGNPGQRGGRWGNAPGFGGGQNGLRGGGYGNCPWCGPGQNGPQGGGNAPAINPPSDSASSGNAPDGNNANSAPGSTMPGA